MQQEIVEQVVYILGKSFEYSVYIAIILVPLKMLVIGMTNRVLTLLYQISR